MTEKVWTGVSVENAGYVDRTDDLQTTGAYDVSLARAAPWVAEELNLENTD